MPAWWADPRLVMMVSDAVVQVLGQSDCECVGRYASVAWFEPEPSAVSWPSHGKAA